MERQASNTTPKERSTREARYKSSLLAKILSNTVLDQCREERRDPEVVRRVAMQLVLVEDVEQKPTAPRTKAFEEMKKLIRLEYKLEDPTWPEGARQLYLANEGKMEAILARLSSKVERPLHQGIELPQDKAAELPVKLYARMTVPNVRAEGDGGGK
ncbi:MAG: hypothetical protein ABL888_21670 [Pirellulaceae bacterium]